MIDELDQALRQLLVRELPIKNGEVDIDFNQPKREWSARLGRPTLNLFLHDLRENVKLRQTAQGWEIERQSEALAVQRRKPFRVDLSYIITAWAREPEDEHRLLARTLMALFRTPELPEDILPESLQNQPAPITLQAAQPGIAENMGDLWGALDNEIRPAITCVVTLAFNPYQPITGPLVRTRELRFGQAHQPWLEKLVQQAGLDTYWTIGGAVRTKKPLDPATLRLTLVEHGLEIQIQPEGRFSIGRLAAGDYTLEISAAGQTRRCKIQVPAPDYEIEI